MIIANYPSITQFQQHVELKDYRAPTKKEYVRYVRKLAEHFQCDSAILTEDQLREYFLFLREHKHYKSSPMKAAKWALRSCVPVANPPSAVVPQRRTFPPPAIAAELPRPLLALLRRTGNPCTGSAALPADLPDPMKRIGQLAHLSASESQAGAPGREGQKHLRALRLLLSIAINLRCHRATLLAQSLPQLFDAHLDCPPTFPPTLCPTENLPSILSEVLTGTLKANRKTTQGSFNQS